MGTDSVEEKINMEAGMEKEYGEKSYKGFAGLMSLFVPQAPQTSHYSRTKSDIWLAISSMHKRLRNGD
ncbi:MAG: hypothetical protein PUE71_09925 [Clostridia bacterium]|nr:hypothetical protein [Clostridia bacterium]